jgi:hypothetical protein
MTARNSIFTFHFYLLLFFPPIENNLFDMVSLNGLDYALALNPCHDYMEETGPTCKIQAIWAGIPGWNPDAWAHGWPKPAPACY